MGILDGSVYTSVSRALGVEQRLVERDQRRADRTDFGCGKRRGHIGVDSPSCHAWSPSAERSRPARLQLGDLLLDVGERLRNRITPALVHSRAELLL